MNTQEQKELIRTAIRSMVTDMVPLQTMFGIVRSVDWTSKTMTVEVDELEIEDVLLSIDGSAADVKKPKVGKKVLCGIIENEEQILFMLWCEEYEEWQLNGDKNGGLVITPRLVQELAKLSARVNRLESAINGGVAATGTPDSGLALITGMKTILEVPIPTEDFSEVENKTIKHG